MGRNGGAAGTAEPEHVEMWPGLSGNRQVGKPTPPRQCRYPTVDMGNGLVGPTPERREAYNNEIPTTSYFTIAVSVRCAGLRRVRGRRRRRLLWREQRSRGVTLALGRWESWLLEAWRGTFSGSKDLKLWAEKDLYGLLIGEEILTSIRIGFPKCSMA
ncbi:hypothetical protein Taro_054878 [Colocasia esculenta]|uniref:Uncharacterized protein n=1 Tax=Colocasia esculenta TaxID=4460 RepID=A0A843XRP1_COLES|nr:hypothetical protein [Colocasia esculenta]